MNINSKTDNENQIINAQYNHVPEQNRSFSEAVEIQQLLKQLEQIYPTSNTAEQMIVATEAIKRIESDLDWKQRVINALKQGNLKTLETHSVGAFVVVAIKSWQSSEDE